MCVCVCVCVYIYTYIYMHVYQFIYSIISFSMCFGTYQAWWSKLRKIPLSKNPKVSNNQDKRSHTSTNIPSTIYSDKCSH